MFKKIFSTFVIIIVQRNKHYSIVMLMIIILYACCSIKRFYCEENIVNVKNNYSFNWIKFVFSHYNNHDTRVFIVQYTRSKVSYVTVPGNGITLTEFHVFV